MTTELTAAQWKLRALMAEQAVWQALHMESYGRLASPDSKDTVRGYLELCKPALLVRNGHRCVEVMQLAEMCGCDLNAEGYDDDHSESSDAGEWLCSRSHLGFICDTCLRPDGDEEGPDWKPEAVEWPCPPIAALNAAVTNVQANEIARKLLATTSEESPR